VAGRGRPKTTVEDKLREKTFNLEVIKKLAIHGLTDKQLADILDVDERTITRWKADPEFMSVLKNGKLNADLEVEDSLRKCALGYYMETEKATKDGVVTVREYYPPNIAAQIFYLKNRQRDRWRDKWPEDAPQAENELSEDRVSDWTKERVKEEYGKLRPKS
jgi:hypothetical protein